MKNLLFFGVCLVAVKSSAQDFVYIHDVIPQVEYDIRYFSTNNFMGVRVDGYKKPIAMLSREAALALKKVQNDLDKQGYGLKIFDAYRPQKGVNHFIRWALVTKDTVTKSLYYPDLDKSVLFDLGYIAERSGHTRGSTLDLTIVYKDTKKEVDMGSPWDFFGDISHHGTTKISDGQTSNRRILQKVMLENGFKQYDNEWWHYTLINEPYPDTYFDFDVK